MPIKEATVEVEKNSLTPEPVTKEVAKCEVSVIAEGNDEKIVAHADVEIPSSVDCSSDLKAPSSDCSSDLKIPSPVACTETVSTAQDAEVTSSDPEVKSIPVEDKSNGSESNSVTETNAEVLKSPSETTSNGNSKPAVATEESMETVEAAAVVDASEKSETVANSENEGKTEAKEPTTEAETSVVDSSSTEHIKEVSDVIPSATKESECNNVHENKQDLPLDNEAESTEMKTEEFDPNTKDNPSENVESVCDTQNSDVNMTGEEGAASEAHAKVELSLPDKEDAKPTETQPGSSSTTDASSDVLAQISDLKKQGFTSFIKKDFCAAADAFGKVLELQAPLYGEMSEKLAETYFVYGTSMYEYGKTVSTVLGEQVKDKDGEDEEEEEEEEEAGDEVEKMEVEADGNEKVETNGESNEEGPAEETTENAEEPEDEDDAFRVAWEMLELAKATFQKGENKKRLADTLMKLGEVGIETGRAEAISEMVSALQVRKEIYSADHRIIPETHFNIGVAYAFFEQYDEAIQHFKDAKVCLEKRIESLKTSKEENDVAEVTEMERLLPDIQEKIQDTLESKADKEKMKEKQTCSESSESKPEATPFPAASSDTKPVTNISHLVKRKRNVDDILPERASKLSRSEESETTAEEKKVASTVADTQPDDDKNAKSSEETKSDPKLTDQKKLDVPSDKTLPSETEQTEGQKEKDEAMAES